MLQTSAVVDKGKGKAVLDLPMLKKPRAEVKRTWATKSGSSSTTGSSNGLVAKLTQEQKKLLDKVKEEVLSLFNEVKSSDKWNEGLDRIIGSRSSQPGRAINERLCVKSSGIIFSS